MITRPYLFYTQPYVLRNECSYPTEVCSSLSSHPEEEEMVEVLMQEYYVLYRSLAQSVVPAIVVLIIGREGVDVLEYKTYDCCRSFV